MIRAKNIKLKDVILSSLIILALLGQPNGISLLFPLLNVVLAVSILISIALSFKVISTISSGFLQFLGFVLLFIGYSFFSLSYAADPVFGLRILISVIFKIIVFCTIYFLVSNSVSLKTAFKTISFTGAFFSVTGILLTIAILIFNLQAAYVIGEVEVGGGMSYEQGLSYYPFLGFIRSSHNIMDLIFPRLQSFFIEPGYFSFFLELSIFSTLGLSKLPEEPSKYKGVLVILFTALALTLSLGGVTSILVGYFFYRHFRSRKYLLFSVFVFIGRILLVSFSIWLIAFIISPALVSEIFKVFVLERFEVDWGASSADVRSNVFRMGMDLFKQSPIFGHGFNQVRILSEGQGANNSFLTIAAEGGIIGLGIYTVITVLLFRFAYKNIRLSATYFPEMHPSQCAVFGGVAAMTFHSFLMDTNWTFLYWIMAALVFASNKVLNHLRPDGNKSLNLKRL